MRKITTYERLDRHIAAWVDREIDPLLVHGRVGIGKIHGYKTALGNRPYHAFGGRQSPLHVYRTLYDDPSLPVVLDDISGLLRDQNFRDMLKALLETGRRAVRWGTTTAKLEGRRTSFVCLAPSLLVMNRLPSRDPDVVAVPDRCDAIEFAPTKTEVIEHMRGIFPEDASLIDLLAELPALPSLRTLVKARKWKASRHLHLIQELLDECGVPEPVAQLARIMDSTPKADWCSRYLAETGLTDRTYRRHKALAVQLLDCRASVGPCPNVREVSMEPVSRRRGASEEGSLRSA